MHVLFVHKNFPAQFGHVARHLIAKHGYQTTFCSQLAPARIDGIERIQYTLQGGATQRTHFCSRTFENATWHAHGVYEALQARPDIRPDLVIGHSGFGSTLFLADLYDCPIINYFEYYYRGKQSDMDFRPEFPPGELEVLRARTRNAMILLDLETCAAGYCPTAWQRSLFPPTYLPKLETIFDGIDTTLWTRRADPPLRQLAGRDIPENCKVVTYVSRGFEAMRGFDIFMKVAGRISRIRDDVLFIVVGEDRVAYGGDLKHIRANSFKEHVLSQDQYDLSRFHFPGLLSPLDLARLLNRSDLHIYLTVPFVLSWSLMDALACGTTVLASATEPVQEMITHEKNGLLSDFHDVDRLTQLALMVLADPAGFRPLGEAGRQMIEEQYSMEAVLPKLVSFYERIASGRVQPSTGEQSDAPSPPPSVADQPAMT